MTTSTTDPVDLSTLLAAPLIALEGAGFSAARAFLDVIREYGFVESDGDRWGAFRYVSLTMRRAQGGDGSDLVVEIPILSLIPLPLVEVKGAELEFNVRLQGFTDDDRPDHADGAFDLDRGRRVFPEAATSPPRLLAGYAGHESREPSMHFKLTVAPSDFPAGITSLLKIMKEATHGR
jgi:hypothetical protein